MINDETALIALEQLSSALVVASRLVVIDEYRDDYVRKSILVASARKASQQVRAIRALSQADCPEEVAGVARVLVEVVINAIYLHYADEVEVRSFLHFDSQKINSRLLSDYISSGRQSEADAAEASLLLQRARTEQDDHAFSWSRKSLTKRATFADTHEPDRILGRLHDMSSRLCNFAVHGTFLSLADLLPDQPDGFPQRKKFAELALNFAALGAETLFQFVARQVQKDTK